MNTLYLICGPPGSGKTTLAIQLAKPIATAVVIAADDYFTDACTGKYTFDPNKLPEAHASCLDRADWHMQLGREVYVTNTFTKAAHREPYYNLAVKHKYFVQEIHLKYPRPEGNTHNVPPRTVDRMCQEHQY